MMSNASDVIAALCAKAADVAFASKISEAATTIKILEQEDENEVKHTTVKKLCSKASSFRVDEVRSALSSSQPRKQECDVDAPTTASCGSAGQLEHHVAKMDLQEILSFTKSFVTIPSGGRQQLADPLSLQSQPFPPPSVITRRASISSTTSSLTDFDHINQPEPHVTDCTQVLESLKLDDLINALRKKVSESPKRDNLTSEVVVALANALSNPDEQPPQILRRNSCIAAESHVAKRGHCRMNDKRKDSSHPALKRHGSNRRGGCLSSSASLEMDNPNKGGHYVNHANLPGSATKPTKRLSFSDSPHAVLDATSNRLRRSSTCSKSTANTSSCGGISHVPDDDELLAHGWKKAMDMATGQYYFYTLDRSKVVWNNPLLASSTAQDEELFITMSGDQDFLQDSFNSNDDSFSDNNPFKVVYSGSQRKS